jgi:hypothetical protein
MSSPISQKIEYNKVTLPLLREAWDDEARSGKIVLFPGMVRSPV